MSRVLKKPFHESFIDCVNPHTDIPENFIIWSALSLVGAALKNSVYFQIGTYTLYPNMFIVLVGPPGVGKGASMNILEQMITDTKPNQVVNTLSDRITAERIIERISDGWSTAPQLKNMQLVLGKNDHNCLLFSSEIRVLLGASDWMLEFLEEAWSKTTYEYQTKNKGNVAIDNMCCSLLAASVPDFLRNVNREAHMVITGGFSSRCLFIYAENPSKDLPFPEPLKKNLKSKALYDNLILDLQEIGTLRGEFVIDTGARLRFEAFLRLNRAASSKDDSEAVANFRARIKAHILKLAMIFSVSRDNSLHISDMDMVNAIAEVQKILVSLSKLFRGAGEGMDAAVTARVQDFIEKYGRVSKKEIFKALHRHLNSPETLDRILYVLEAIGYCTVVNSNKMTFYQPVAKSGKVGP
jgi:energy-coupling factor transporter ATP-binding protein EcfA2